MEIYVHPLTTAELQVIVGDDSGGNTSRLQRAINTIIARARTSDGKKMFDRLPIIEEQLRGLMPPALLIRLASEINDDMVGMFGEEATEAVKK
jgi:hypothetical protein